MNSVPDSSAAPPTASPTQLVEAYLAAWNTRDGAAVVAAIAPDGTYVDPILPGPVSGEVLAGYVNVLATAVPDFTFTTESLLESGQRVILHWTMTGTFTGPMPDLPGPTGASFELPGVDLIDVGPDGVRRIVGFFDQLTLWRQMGIEVKPTIAE